MVQVLRFGVEGLGLQTSGPKGSPMRQFGAWTLWIEQPDFKTAVFWGYGFEVWVALEPQASDLVFCGPAWVLQGSVRSDPGNLLAVM